MPEGCVDDPTRAPGIDHRALAVRFKRRLDAGFFVGGESRSVVVDRSDHVAASRQLAQLGRNVLAIPRQDSGGLRGFTLDSYLNTVPDAWRAPRLTPTF